MRPLVARIGLLWSFAWSAGCTSASDSSNAPDASEIRCAETGRVCASLPGSTVTCEDGACVARRSSDGARIADCDGRGVYDVHLDSDARNCGGCGRWCAFSLCTNGSCCGGAGACVSDCAAFETRCNGYCVDLQSNSDHCGACGRHCPGGQVCLGGVCRFPCWAGLTSCDDGCRDLSSDVRNCGSCGNACQQPNATMRCDGGQCARVTCLRGYDDCDGAPSTGCETPTLADPNNCGSCGRGCSPDQRCIDGRCRLTTCDAGHADCDGDRANGCERDLRTDVANCSACGRTCQFGAVCVEGVCTCPPGTSLCSGICQNILTSPFHCGDCFRPCVGGDCIGGHCVCPAGFQYCGRCIDVQHDADNCGTCDHRCGIEGCTQGQCSCNGEVGWHYCYGRTLDDRICVDTLHDVQHCGDCGHACDAGLRCVEGVCTP